MDIQEYRLRFLQQLRTMPVRYVRHLLTMESPEELSALRDACFPQDDEAMRGVIEQEIEAQNAALNGGEPAPSNNVVTGVTANGMSVQ